MRELIRISKKKKKKFNPRKIIEIIEIELKLRYYSVITL